MWAGFIEHMIGTSDGFLGGLRFSRSEGYSVITVFVTCNVISCLTFMGPCIVIIIIIIIIINIKDWTL